MSTAALSVFTAVFGALCVLGAMDRDAGVRGWRFRAMVTTGYVAGLGVLVVGGRG